MKSANVPGLVNRHLGDTSAEKDHLPDKTETVLTGDDRTLVHLTASTGDEENTRAKETESTKTEIVSIRKASEETEIDQDLAKRSTRREDKADQILQESEVKLKQRPDLYHGT